jgi:hypothetical protein
MTAAREGRRASPADLRHLLLDLEFEVGERRPRLAGMPATFPAHSAAVLPLKMRWPRAFDGVALVVGSTGPDQAYAVYGWWHIPATHEWLGLLWFVLPMTLAETWLCRRAAPVVAAHLAALRRPSWLGRVVDLFAPGDYGALALRRWPLWVSACSAVLGGATHLVWDGLAHPPGAPGWANNLMPFLRTPAIEHWAWWRYGESVSSVVGGVLAILMFARIGRRRLVRAWDGPAPVVRLAPARFWTVAVLPLLVDVATWPIQDYKRTTVVQGERLLWAVSTGLLLAAWAASRATRSPAGAVGSTAGRNDAAESTDADGVTSR